MYKYQNPPPRQAPHRVHIYEKGPNAELACGMPLRYGRRHRERCLLLVFKISLLRRTWARFSLVGALKGYKTQTFMLLHGAVCK